MLERPLETELTIICCTYNSDSSRAVLQRIQYLRFCFVEWLDSKGKGKVAHWI
jgi:hypothetical protein